MYKYPHIDIGNTHDATQWSHIYRKIQSQDMTDKLSGYMKDYANSIV